MHIEKVGISSSINATSIGSIREERPEEMGMASETKRYIKILDGYFLSNLGWFKGLSHIFLNIHIPKILLTAEK